MGEGVNCLIWYQSHHNWTTSYFGRTRRSCVGIHPYMASCYWSISGASGWLVKWECACEMGTFIVCYNGSCTWSEPDQYMYMKEELTQCNHFSMVHTLTAFTGEWVEDISNSYPMFIKVLQPVTHRQVQGQDQSTPPKGLVTEPWTGPTVPVWTNEQTKNITLSSY